MANDSDGYRGQGVDGPLMTKLGKARARISMMRMGPMNSAVAAKAAAQEFEDALNGLEAQLLAPARDDVLAATAKLHSAEPERETLEAALVDIGIECAQLGKATDETIVDFIKRLADVLDMPTLDEWIEREFTGKGVAVRQVEDWPIPGEPMMSMAEAKASTRRAVILAVAKFGIGTDEWPLIEQLRESEGAEVTIFCDDPDAGANNAIEICDDWTGWDVRRFAGDSVLDCLRTALKARDDVQGKPKVDSRPYCTMASAARAEGKAGYVCRYPNCKCLSGSLAESAD